MFECQTSRLKDSIWIEIRRSIALLTKLMKNFKDNY